jgi:hypothetical protein
VVIVQQPSDTSVDFLLTGSNGSTALPKTAQPGAALARIR